MANISPQGYSYGKEPTSTNPFWNDEKLVVPDISADATVDETTGTPAVEVEKTQDGTDVQFNFAFSGLKGEQGEQGPQGEQGETGATGPAPTVTSTGSTEAGALAGTITGDDGTVINVYNGSGGGELTLPDNAFNIYILQANRPSTSSYAYADWHLYHIQQYGKDGNLQTGTNQDIYIRVPNYLKTYTGLTLTNENGVYTLTGRKPITSSPYYTEEVIGTIEVPDVDTENVLAEIADSVVSNDSYGYDFHTIKETEYNGTQNEVGKFYIAQKQTTDLTSQQPAIGAGIFKRSVVDQSGNEEGIETGPYISVYGSTDFVTIQKYITTSNTFIAAHINTTTNDIYLPVATIAEIQAWFLAQEESDLAYSVPVTLALSNLVGAISGRIHYDTEQGTYTGSIQLEFLNTQSDPANISENIGTLELVII